MASQCITSIFVVWILLERYSVLFCFWEGLNKIFSILVSCRVLVCLLVLLFTPFLLSSCAADVDVPVVSARFIITPGVGLAECGIGKDESCFIEWFGGEQWEDYWIAKSKGVDIRVKNGKIISMFFYFYSRSHVSFDGKTNVGIGKNTTIDDVIRAYGKPFKIGKSMVPSSGAMPGAHEISLVYPSMGIEFTFWDRRLADVRVYEARPY
ncbi:hypothetical protein [Pseudomonas brenneri]